MNFAWLKAEYANNRRFRAAVQAAEGGLLGGFLSATANGFSFTAVFWQRLGLAMAAGALIAVRNFFLTPPPPEAK